MEHRKLTTTNSLRSLILSPSFAVPFSSVTTTSILLGYYVEKQSYPADSLSVPFVYPALAINILSFAAFLSIIVFCSSYRITGAVVEGSCPAISISRFKGFPWPFSLICGTEGNRSLIKFVFQMVCFPGLSVLCGLHILSFFCGSSPFSWNLPFDMFLASNSLWRLILSVSIFTLNFFSALNPTQPSISDFFKEE